MPDRFHSSSGEELTLPAVVRAVIAFMKAAPARDYKITVGTDSELLASKSADFVSAVVVHRIGNGGRYFFRRFTEGRFHTLRDRIVREALLSIELSKRLLIELEKLAPRDTAPRWEFEVHIDVGEGGPTKPMIQEVVGMVRAHNLAAITKPGSYAASNVADRHV